MDPDFGSLFEEDLSSESDSNSDSDHRAGNRLDPLATHPGPEISGEDPFDLSATVPHELAAYPEDAVDQSAVLRGIVGTSRDAEYSRELFDRTPIYKLMLSDLQDIYERFDKNAAMDLLSVRHFVEIDKDFTLPLGGCRVNMNTDESLIDYHLTVANRIGFSSLLPNVRSDHRFAFEMDLKKPFVAFKGKHAQLGFDPTGRMLFIGRCNNEDVFLAMAPNGFLQNRAQLSPSGHSSGPPVMSRRHYRQVVMLLAHFLAQLPARAYYTIATGGVYGQNLTSKEPNFHRVTNVMVDRFVRLNFEELSQLDDLVVEGYDNWVKVAPADWKFDGFLEGSTPILVTSRYGQNARIAVPGNESDEARAWYAERDYSRLAYFTFAIATSIKCIEVIEWVLIDTEDIREDHPEGIFDDPRPDRHLPVVDLDSFDLLDANGREVPIFDIDGKRIRRRLPRVDPNDPPCGVLVNLTNIQALFNQHMFAFRDHEGGDDDDDDGDDVLSASYNPADSRPLHIDAYPLAFLKSAGNIQANDIPPCFYPEIARINESVGKHNRTRPSASGRFSDPHSDDDDDPLIDVERFRGAEPTGSLRAVKPVSAQFYNYVTHRVASGAGQHDAQQGNVTAAISGAFAMTEKDKRTARKKQSFCEDGLPSDRFHRKISLTDAPICCRAEFVYTVDVRALDDPSGSSIFENIIVPLARSWKLQRIRETIKDYLLVLKPRVFPALFDWVSFPITALIRSIYDAETGCIKDKKPPCPFRLELLAALERTLCFCHTGNTAVLATSLMNPLGLSRGIIRHGYPMLHGEVFTQPTVPKAIEGALEIDHRFWPRNVRDGYPAVASKRAQILTYSERHFMAYQAFFRIKYALLLPDMVVCDPELPSVDFAKGVTICKIAFEAFFEDTRHLVAQGVRADIRKLRASASSPLPSERAVLRESSLASWLKCPLPLSYGHRERDDVYKFLLEAVSSSDELVAHGLPNWVAFKTSRAALARDLVEMSLPKKPHKSRAPVLQTGSFLPVLKLAVKFIWGIFVALEGGARKDAVINTLALSLTHLKINFFPAPELKTSSRGAPSTKPVWNSWGCLGDPDGRDLFVVRPSRPRSILQPAKVAFNNAIANDCNAPWSAESLTPSTLHSVTHCMTLPGDFVEILPTGVPVIDDTYRWVKRCYSGRKPLHHLALLVAIIAASTLLPNLYTPRGIKAEFSGKSAKGVRDLLNDKDWIPGKTNKGMIDKKIFISMITTFIIAVYEEESPLRKHMASSGGGFGDKWREKHAAKGITYTTLIRLGILWGYDTGAYERGRFGNGWGCHESQVIQVLYDHLRKCLNAAETNPTSYGPFDALCLLIGERNARLASAEKGICMRPPMESSQTDRLVESMYPSNPSS